MELKAYRKNRSSSGVVTTMKEMYGYLEGYISQEGKEHGKVLCHRKHDAFMEMKKATDG